MQPASFLQAGSTIKSVSRATSAEYLPQVATPMVNYGISTPSVINAVFPKAHKPSLFRGLPGNAAVPFSSS
jgi:hypothetical protein